MRSRIANIVNALLVGLGYGSAAFPPLFLSLVSWLSVLARMAAAIGALAIGLGVFLVLLVAPWTKRIATPVLILAILPSCGLFLNALLPTCSNECVAIQRRLAIPEVYGLFAGYGATVLAYVVSRLRPERQRPPSEILIMSGLLFGTLLMFPVFVQFGPLSWLLGLLLPPFALPTLAPLGVFALYAAEFRRRIRRRLEQADGLSRAGFVAQLAGGTLLLLGVYAVLHGLWQDDASGALRVLTRTCGAAFSRLPPPRFCN